jgi:ankyrin repeat protein
MLNCTDPQRILEILADTETSYTDYKATLEKSSAKDFRTGQSFPFSSMFSMDDRIADLKLKCLFQHVKRLELNPNGKFEMPERFKNFKQLDWKNTPLHLYIGNERFNIVKSCISYARENDVSIDFNVQDKEGKTPLLLSAKMGNIPLDVFRQMLTLENYNMPDSTGITPAMMACAMRRPDLLAALVQFHAEKVLVLNNFHIDHLSDEHKRQIQAFINQQQVKTKKSLGHFAIMRHGTEEELDKPDEYQQTVLNIAKSVGIDARMDKNALLNAERNDGGGQATIIEEEVGPFKQMLKMANLKRLDVKELGLDPKDPDQFQLIFAKYSYRKEETVYSFTGI